MKRLTSLSLTLRIFVLLLVGVSLAAALTFWLAQRDRREVIAHFHGREAVQRVSDMLRLLSTLPAAQRIPALRDFSPDEWRLAPLDECSGAPAPHLLQGLTDRLARTHRIDGAFRQRQPDDTATGPPARPPQVAVIGSFGDGTPFCLIHQGQRRMPPQIEQWRFPASIGLFVALIALIAWFAVRLAIRPLKRMTTAAEAFGNDIRHPPIASDGPGEVRQAAVAFNRMQERVRKMMGERTQILAAVTHDLKTPLTRMRLRIENCSDATLREKLGNDLDAMQRLVDEGLALARSMESAEPAVAVDLGALVSSIADDAADAGQPVRHVPSGALHATCQPNGLRRAIENLVDNALKYAGDAELSIVRDGELIRIRIRDHGPGIPETHLQDVLTPFVRLETSRSRESGGTGLGLAIANNLIAAQGGELALVNHPEGGLEAVITLRTAPRV